MGEGSAVTKEPSAFLSGMASLSLKTSIMIFASTFCWSRQQWFSILSTTGYGEVTKPYSAMARTTSEEKSDTILYIYSTFIGKYPK